MRMAIKTFIANIFEMYKTGAIENKYLPAIISSKARNPKIYSRFPCDSLESLLLDRLEFTPEQIIEE